MSKAKKEYLKVKDTIFNTNKIRDNYIKYLETTIKIMEMQGIKIGEAVTHNMKLEAEKSELIEDVKFLISAISTNIWNCKIDKLKDKYK